MLPSHLRLLDLEDAIGADVCELHIHEAMRLV